MRKIADKSFRRHAFILMLCMCFMMSMIPCKVYATDDAIDEQAEEVMETDDVSAKEDNSETARETYEYVNPNTNYKAIIEDTAGLLSDTEKTQLLLEMEKITNYGHAAFHTTDANNSTADSYASGYYHNKFNKESGSLFLIDMDNRKVYIFSDGDIYKTVTKTYANVITDNVYTYASKQDYYTCASKVFEQEYDLLEGRRIAQPMKYISNALLAIVIALLLNYTIVRAYSSSKAPSRKELLDGIFMDKKLNNPKAVFTNETKRYDPVESSSGGSSGGGGGFSGGGGGFSGGGGSSGGGGGHSF